MKISYKKLWVKALHPHTQMRKVKQQLLPLFIVLLNTKENDDERTTYPRDTAQNVAVSQQ